MKLQNRINKESVKQRNRNNSNDNFENDIQKERNKRLVFKINNKRSS